MRRSRLKLLHQSACYHIVCRITQGQLWLPDAEKINLCALMERVAPYCGVEVLTFSVMSNHFHLLVRIPEKASADSAVDGIRLSDRVRLLYGDDAAENVLELWEGRSTPGIKSLWESELEMHLGRMHDLSVFMQLLKQRFTMGYNRHHDTKGTLWTERFKSVLVEARAGERNPLEIVAAYIDLNPVRAGIVDEAQDYAYSGFGRACAGHAPSQQGLLGLLEAGDWTAARERYELLLGGNFAPFQNSELVQPVTEASTSAVDQKSLATALRCRQAALVKGAVFGSAKFVLEILLAMVEIRRSARPQVFASGGFGGDLWVGKRYRP
jgi:putative transposase